MKISRSIVDRPTNLSCLSCLSCLMQPFSFCFAAATTCTASRRSDRSSGRRRLCLCVWLACLCEAGPQAADRVGNLLVLPRQRKLEVVKHETQLRRVVHTAQRHRLLLADAACRITPRLKPVREVVQIDVEAGGAEGAGCGACPASEGEVCAESRESVCLGGVVACGVLGFDAICDNAAVPTIVVACQVCAPSHQPTDQPADQPQQQFRFRRVVPSAA